MKINLLIIFLLCVSSNVLAMQVKEVNVYTDYTISEFLNLDVSNATLIKFFPEEYTELSNRLNNYDLTNTTIQYKCWGSTEIGEVHYLSDYKTGFDICTGTATSTIAFYPSFHIDLQNLLNLNVVDITPPVLNLIGSATIQHLINTTYTDQGSTCIDNLDGDISLSIQQVNNVDPNIEGTYSVIYDCTDSSGNSANQIIRTVNVYVLSDLPPIIELIGPGTINLSLGEIYSEQGATAIDNEDGDLTNFITITNNVNTNIAGNYNVVYSVIDSGSNKVSIARTIIVTDPLNTETDLTEIQHTLVMLGMVLSSLLGFSNGLTWRL